MDISSLIGTVRQIVRHLGERDAHISAIEKEHIPTTELAAQAQGLIKAILAYSGRMQQFFIQAKPLATWSLTTSMEPSHYSKNVVECLFASNGKGQRIQLSYNGAVEKIKPSEVLGVVSALTTIPEVLLAWEADVKKGEKSSAEKLKKTEAELKQAEIQLQTLCKELIKISERVIGAGSSDQQTET